MSLHQIPDGGAVGLDIEVGAFHPFFGELDRHPLNAVIFPELNQTTEAVIDFVAFPVQVERKSPDGCFEIDERPPVLVAFAQAVERAVELQADVALPIVQIELGVIGFSLASKRGAGGQPQIGAEVVGDQSDLAAAVFETIDGIEQLQLIGQGDVVGDLGIQVGRRQSGLGEVRQFVVVQLQLGSQGDAEAYLELVQLPFVTGDNVLITVAGGQLRLFGLADADRGFESGFEPVFESGSGVGSTLEIKESVPDVVA